MPSVPPRKKQKPISPMIASLAPFCFKITPTEPSIKAFPIKTKGMPTKRAVSDFIVRLELNIELTALNLSLSSLFLCVSQAFSGLFACCYEFNDEFVVL